MFNIDKDIEVPDSPLLGVTAYLRTLNIGDSFLCPPKTRNGLQQVAKRIGIKLVTRAEGDSIRVWRKS